jgi:hypothetical protein
MNIRMTFSFSRRTTHVVSSWVRYFVSNLSFIAVLEPRLANFGLYSLFMARQNSWRSSVSTETRLRVERSTFRLPVGADDYTYSTTSACYVTGNVITFPGVGGGAKRLWPKAVQYPVPKFRISRVILLLPQYAFMAYTRAA